MRGECPFQDGNRLAGSRRDLPEGGPCASRAWIQAGGWQKHKRKVCILRSSSWRNTIAFVSGKKSRSDHCASSSSIERCRPEVEAIPHLAAPGNTFEAISNAVDSAKKKASLEVHECERDYRSPIYVSNRNFRTSSAVCREFCTDR